MTLNYQPVRRKLRDLFGANRSASWLTEHTQSLSGAGAVRPDKEICFFTSTGSNALTLVDGGRIGQEVHIVHVVDGGSGTLTAGSALHLAHVPTSATGITSIALTNVNDWVTLKWSGKAWVLVGYNGATITG